MRTSLLIITLFFVFPGISQKLVTTKVGEDISIKVPAEFVNMNNQSRMERVASSKIPLAMFSDQSQEVTLGINDNAMQWTAQDTKTIYGFYKASIQSLFDEIEFIQDTVRTVNGKEFVIFEFVSTVRDDNTFTTRKPDRNYTYIQYTSYRDQVLLFNFGCPARRKLEWEDAARMIMESVRVR